jgi:hypothetical protein
VDNQFFALGGRARGEQIEAAQRHAEAFVENYYRKHAPAFMAAHLLFPADDFFRSIVTKAMAVYENFFDRGGEGITHDGLSGVIGPDALVAISTSRPGTRWVIRNGNGLLLGNVLEIVKNDSWCDIDMSGTGYCIEGMRKYKADRHSYVGFDYTPNLPFLIPFSNGNIIIFGHVCYACWQQYLKKSKIKSQKCEIFQPICDGFGAL